MSNPAQKSNSSNYYRILGTNSNAGPELIKQRYLEKVRIFTPEKDPEEFKRIRKAYETLKDPFERSQYDLETKYQGKADRLLHDALFNMKFNRLNQAHRLLREAEEIAADNLYILKIKADLLLKQGNLNKFEETFNRIESIAKGYKMGLILQNKAFILLERGYLEQVEQTLKRIVSSGLEKKDDLFELYYELYDKKDDFRKIWDLFEEKFSNIDNYAAENIKYFNLWINNIISYRKYDKGQYVIDLFSEYLEQIKENEEEMEMVFEIILDEYEEYREMGAIEALGIYAPILSDIKDDPPYREELQNMESIIKINREIDKMAEDRNIYPFVFYRVIEWFVQWAFPGEDPDKYAEFPPPFIMSEYEEEHLDNVNTVNLIRTEYPLVYEKFRDRIEQIYEYSYNSLENWELQMLDKQIETGADSEYTRKKSGQIVRDKKVGRNDPCPCGSGRKYKKCCGR